MKMTLFTPTVSGFDAFKNVHTAMLISNGPTFPSGEDQLLLLGVDVNFTLSRPN